MVFFIPELTDNGVNVQDEKLLYVEEGDVDLLQEAPADLQLVRRLDNTLVHK